MVPSPVKVRVILYFLLSCSIAISSSSVIKKVASIRLLIGSNSRKKCSFRRSAPALLSRPRAIPFLFNSSSTSLFIMPPLSLNNSSNLCSRSFLRLDFKNGNLAGGMNPDIGLSGSRGASVSGGVAKNSTLQFGHVRFWPIRDSGTEHPCEQLGHV